MKHNKNDNKCENLSCWVVGEGLIGTENQCIAVAESLSVSYEIKRITLREPWKSLSPYLGFECAYTFCPTLTAPWPDLVIASGRKSIAAARYIKRMSGGKSFTLYLQDPRINPKTFDMVAVAHHDPTRGKNVIVTDAAPNRITADKLSAAQENFPAFADIPAPRIAVLIGGNSKAYRLTPAITRELAAQLKPYEAQLMITPSRRTGAQNEAILREALPNAYIYDGTGDNPYFAMLGAADIILATSDSASMLSDACTTGKPTYMINLEGGHPRIDALHNHLQNLGALRVFDGRLDHYDYTPLNDAQKIAERLRERMKL